MYARSGDTYGPVFVRGQVVPSAFGRESPLIAALQARTGPLAAERRGRAAPGLGPFDRAALETLDVSVVLPVRRRDELMAFVALGAKRSGDVYTSTGLALLAAVGRKAGDELVRFDLAEIIREGQTMQEALRRYVPASVVQQLAEGRPLDATEHDVSVLFVDIRGYTTYSETRPAGEVYSTINRYAETVSSLIRRHGGAVAEFTGDGMMAVFGAPEALAEKERAAVEAGRRIVDAVAALAPAEGLAVGVGIATGPAVVGDVRAAERRIWTAIGDTVNLAARLQELTRPLRAAIVIDAATWRGARYVAADFVRHGETAIRGRAAAEDVFVLPAA